jgi:voltage-gated sodium channel
MTNQAGAIGDHRARLRTLVESRRFRHSVLVLIGINAITLGLETSPTAMRLAGDALIMLDHAIMAVFVAEIALRIYAHGLRFFRDPWGVFDFVIVAIALAPASEAFSALRALRVLRALRLVSGVPRLRRVVEALLRAVPGIGAIGSLLLLIFYVFAVIATKLFAAKFPAWFGSIGESMYSLFQIMTLESWSMGIVRPVMEVYPYAWAFFVPFIIVSSFTVLNLFIAIIVDSMQTLHKSEEQEAVKAISDVVHQDTGEVESEIAALRRDVRALHALLEEKLK